MDPGHDAASPESVRGFLAQRPGVPYYPGLLPTASWVPFAARARIAAFGVLVASLA